MRIKYLSILLIVFPVAANEFKSPQAQRIAEQMSQVIAQKVQEITALEQEMGVKDVQIHLTQLQQYSSGRFGITLSANSPGLVISVTPNSHAGNIGIQNGDQIVSVNGTEVASNIKSALAVLQYVESETNIEIELKRSGELITLNGTLAAKLIPAWTFSTQAQEFEWPSITAASGNEKETNKQECGQVKLGFRIESGYKTRSLKTVVVVEAIDGVKVENPLDKNYLKIPVGYHKLTVHRKIHHFDKNRAESAEFNIRIDADTSYFLAYRSDTLFSSSYTLKYAEQPVIWKTKQQKCEM